MPKYLKHKYTQFIFRDPYFCNPKAVYVVLIDFPFWCGGMKRGRKSNCLELELSGIRPVRVHGCGVRKSKHFLGWAGGGGFNGYYFYSSLSNDLSSHFSQYFLSNLFF